MKQCISKALISMSTYVCPFWEKQIQEVFGIQSVPKEPEIPLDPIILRQTFHILNLMPSKMVRDCGVGKLYLSYRMGKNRPFYPNHGYFDPQDKTVTLNADIFENPDTPDDFYDDQGYFVSRPVETVLHEFGHALDDAMGDISLKDDWLKLSGWSEIAKPGLKQLVIDEPGMPRVIGEWFYNPKAKFTRFYAQRNPWDDWADSFAFYFAKMKSKVPEDKRNYFNSLQKKYSSK